MDAARRFVLAEGSVFTGRHQDSANSAPGGRSPFQHSPLADSAYRWTATLTIADGMNTHTWSMICRLCRIGPRFRGSGRCLRSSRNTLRRFASPETETHCGCSLNTLSEQFPWNWEWNFNWLLKGSQNNVESASRVVVKPCVDPSHWLICCYQIYQEYQYNDQLKHQLMHSDHNRRFTKFLAKKFFNGSYVKVNFLFSTPLT